MLYFNFTRGDLMSLTHRELEQLKNHLRPLLAHPKVQEMNHYMQHGQTSCLTHCLTVTYYSYLFAKRLSLPIDETSLVRGALLHDFFLYDWHDKQAHKRWHGFRHPNIALNHAQYYFDLTPKEMDMIKHHMWPLTPVPPLCLEGWLITLMDKWCSLLETFHCAKPLDFLQYDAIKKELC